MISLPLSVVAQYILTQEATRHFAVCEGPHLSGAEFHRMAWVEKALQDHLVSTPLTLKKLSRRFSRVGSSEIEPGELAVLESQHGERAVIVWNSSCILLQKASHWRDNS